MRKNLFEIIYLIDFKVRVEVRILLKHFHPENFNVDYNRLKMEWCIFRERVFNSKIPF